MTLVLAAVVATGIVLWWWQSTHGLLARRAKRRVVVTLHDGSSWAGVLLDADRDVLVVVQAEFLHPDGNPVPADGEVILLRSEVRFLQVPERSGR